MTETKIAKVEKTITQIRGRMPTKPVPSEPVDEGEFYSLADVDPIGSQFEALFYGAPKTGKTCMAAQWIRPPFRWLDADGGLKSVRWAVKEGLTQIKDLNKDLIAARPIEQQDDATGYRKAEAFDKTCDIIDHWMNKDRDNWNTLVIDSFTEINEWAISKGLVLNASLPSENRPLSGSHKINLKARTRLIVGQQDYKSAQGLCSDFLNDTRVDCTKYGKDLIVICHRWTEEERDEHTGSRRVIAYMPLLIGQLRERMTTAFNDIWYFEMRRGTKGPECHIQFHADAKKYAGTRWGNCLNVTEPAIMKDIIAKVKTYHD